LLPACDDPFWSVEPTPDVLSSPELELDVDVPLEEPELDDVPLDGLLVEVPDEVPDVLVEDVPDEVPDVLVEEVPDVPVWASAVEVTAETRPKVSALAAATARPPAMVARVRSDRAFIATTIAAGGSGPHHHNVKASSSRAGCSVSPLRGRVARG
jgi:hypothetical protein